MHPEANLAAASYQHAPTTGHIKLATLYKHPRKPNVATTCISRCSICTGTTSFCRTTMLIAWAIQLYNCANHMCKVAYSTCAAWDTIVSCKAGKAHRLHRLV